MHPSNLIFVGGLFALLVLFVLARQHWDAEQARVAAQRPQPPIDPAPVAADARENGKHASKSP